jgi:transcriptional regulator with XRE-family HTH domain
MAPSPSSPTEPDFAGRVRALLNTKGMTLAQLAQGTELDASLLSRLTAENDSTRRAPQIEHVFAIARSLGTSPAELVQGTSAASILGEWVRATEYAREAQARAAAQQEATELRSQVAELTAVAAARGRECDDLRTRLTGAERALAQAQRERDGLRARQTEVERQRQEALATAFRHQQLTAAAQAQVENLAQQLQGAKSSATTAWTITGLGALTAILSGSSKSRPKGRRRQ